MQVQENERPILQMLFTVFLFICW